MRFILLFFLIVSTQTFSQEKMPNLTVKDLQNKPVHINNDFNETDKIYVFSFWATWCAPCISELEAISEHYSEWSEELNMEVIAVSTDDSRTQRRVRPLLKIGPTKS